MEYNGIAGSSGIVAGTVFPYKKEELASLRGCAEKWQKSLRRRFCWSALGSMN